MWGGSRAELSASVVRWASVLLIVALFAVDRFGGTDLQSLNLSFLAAYLFLILTAFGLPLAEGRSHRRLIEWAALGLVFLGVVLLFTEPFSLAKAFPFLKVSTLQGRLGAVLLVGVAVWASVRLLVPLVRQVRNAQREPLRIAGQRHLVSGSAFFVCYSPKCFCF